MFARMLIVNLKPGLGPESAAAIDEKVIPIMREFPGFRDEIVMLSTDGRQFVGISMWDSAEQADAYKRGAYARVLDLMTPFIDGQPTVTTHDVTVSTAHHIVTHAAGV